MLFLFSIAILSSCWVVKAKDAPTCSRAACSNHGDCIDLGFGFICHCDVGYGGSRCEDQANICDTAKLEGWGCENDSACGRFPNNTGFVCQCEGYWKGKRCEIPIPQPCSDLAACSGHGTCVPQVPDWLQEVCLCDLGWAGKRCEHKYVPCEGQPAHEDSKLCSHHGRCYTKPGGDPHDLGCVCNKGWYGGRCDLEWPNPCAHNCSRHGTCHKTGTHKTGFMCACNRGYTGEKCEFSLTHCSIAGREGKFCRNGGICIDKPGLFEYECACPEMWTGKLCDIPAKKPCSQMPCGAHGTCITDNDNLYGYVCQCARGWVGHQCEHEANACALAGRTACRNGGVCYVPPTSDGTTYACDCPHGWHGEKCEEKITVSSKLTPCETAMEKGVTCQHGGICFNHPNGYDHFCQCRDGWHGTLCELRRNEQKTTLKTACDVLIANKSSCLHGGICFNHPDGKTHHCDCPDGWTGRICEHPSDNVQKFDSAQLTFILVAFCGCFFLSTAVIAAAVVCVKRQRRRWPMNTLPVVYTKSRSSLNPQDTASDSYTYPYSRFPPRTNYAPMEPSLLDTYQEPRE